MTSPIRILYEAEPDFLPAEQHPDAVRYQAGEFWVDALGGTPPDPDLDRILEALGRLAYQRRREARERMSADLVARLTATKGRGF